MKHKRWVIFTFMGLCMPIPFWYGNAIWTMPLVFQLAWTLWGTLAIILWTGLFGLILAPLFLAQFGVGALLVWWISKKIENKLLSDPNPFQNTQALLILLAALLALSQAPIYRMGSKPWTNIQGLRQMRFQM